MANLEVTTNFANAVKTEYERRLLGRLLPRLVHGKWGTPARLNQFGTYELRRYESLSAITAALGTEGVTPGENAAPSLTVLTVTPAQYGTWLG
jgi:hypothetical protein